MMEVRNQNKTKNKTKKKKKKKKAKKMRMTTKLECNNSQLPEYFERPEIYNSKKKRLIKETLIKSNCRRKN